MHNQLSSQEALAQAQCDIRSIARDMDAIEAYHQLDAVNEFGIVAGCHRVSWAEADRFAMAQGWTS